MLSIYQILCFKLDIIIQTLKMLINRWSFKTFAQFFIFYNVFFDLNKKIKQRGVAG